MFVLLTGVDDALQLEGGELPVIDDVLREGELIPAMILIINSKG